MELTIGSFNIMSGFNGVGNFEHYGLNELGRNSDPEIVKGSIHDSDPEAWKQYSNWNERVDAIAMLISKLDVVCLQETTLLSTDELAAKTGMAIASGAYRPNDDPRRRIGVSILYNPTKLKIIQSFNPCYSYKKITRKAACADLCDINNKVYRIASVHLKGYNPYETDVEVKAKQKKTGFFELLHYIKKIENCSDHVHAKIIAGDLNEDPTEIKINPYLYRLGLLTQFHYNYSGNAIYNGTYLPTDHMKERRIDWIYHKSSTNNEELKAYPLNLETNQPKVSDHFLTGAKLFWEGTSGITFYPNTGKNK